jgi:hypothetical protein
MASTRIIAILVGMGSLFLLETWLDVRWYISVPIGVIVYLVIRYGGWAIIERRRFNQEMDQVVKKASGPTTGQNSN